jgi:hypothetical protein
MESYENLLNQDLSSPSKQINLMSNVYRVIKGGFDIDGVETYLGSASVSMLKEDIEVFERLTEDKSWPVSTIIQREVDERRVNEIANDFILRDIKRVKYFPPIVVAIVSRNQNDEISRDFKIKTVRDESIFEQIRVKGNYNDKLKDNFKKANDLSTLEGFYVLDWFQELAQLPLCWDKGSIYSIVIDGQHRLEALKLAYKKNSKIGNYKQDIVFLDLSKKAVQENRSPVEAIRRIFIDINYNAKQVTNARRTLMDDKDLSSLIVQNLVNDDDQNGNRIGKFLKPQLVDWHSENLKHSFPLITGVLILQQIIEDNFLQGANLSSISDLRKPSKVFKFTNTLNSRFLVDERILNKINYQGIKKLEESYNEYLTNIGLPNASGDEEDILFSMDYNVLNVARDTFEEIYAKSVVTFFNTFLPYKRAINILSNENVFDVSDIKSRLIIKLPKKLNQAEQDLMLDLTNKMHLTLDENFYLCFTVLGQKSFFRHYYKELLRHLQNVSLDEKSVYSFTTDYIKKINSILENLQNSSLFSSDQKFQISNKLLKSKGIEIYGSVAQSFWQGIIYNENNIVYNNQGIDGLVGVIDYLYKSYPIEKQNGKIKFPDEQIWVNIPYSPSRITRKMKQEFPHLDPNQVEDISNNIWQSKLESLKELITGCN